MRILIAGGAGFLGSHLADRYAENHDVVIVDNLSTSRTDTINHLTGNPKVTFVRADITGPLPSSITDLHFDVIANLASPASPPAYQRLALPTLHVGSIGVEQLLQLAKQNNARFFHASTSEVYGDPLVHPQKESYNGNTNCYGPRAMYDESKRYGEALIYVYRQQYKMNTGIIRIFNTYGPRMDPKDGRVVSNFIVQALEGKSLTVYGDGKQTRSFCYVSDLIDGMVRFIDSNEEGPMNLGNPVEFTIGELAAKVKLLVGSDQPIEYRPMPVDDPLQRKPDISLVNERLGWEPKIQLEEGLAKTIDYFRHHLATQKTKGEQ